MPVLSSPQVMTSGGSSEKTRKRDREREREKESTDYRWVRKGFVSVHACMCACGCTQAASLDGDMGRVVPSEEGRVNVDAMDKSRDPQLDNAPVMTFSRQKNLQVKVNELTLKKPQVEVYCFHKKKFVTSTKFCESARDQPTRTSLPAGFPSIHPLSKLSEG